MKANESLTASELRIGNLIDKGGVVFKVLTIDEDGCVCEPLNEYDPEYNSWKISGVEPIPLTEEWLIKFGFDMINDAPKTIKYYRLNGISFEVLKDDRVANKPNEAIKLYDNIGLWNTTYKHIKNVHQLQNLYFALTGEELVINDKIN